jgi:hypothetical protein
MKMMPLCPETWEPSSEWPQLTINLSEKLHCAQAAGQARARVLALGIAEQTEDPAANFNHWTNLYGLAGLAAEKQNHDPASSIRRSPM